FVGMISRHRIAGWPSCTFLSTQARWKQYMRSSQSADAPRRTALVLSGGGMFGAYQAGVWAALHNSIQLDMVVGASIGCLNGWLIAGGCSGDALAEQWLSLGSSSRVEWRYPKRLSEGIIDFSLPEGWMRK